MDIYIYVIFLIFSLEEGDKGHNLGKASDRDISSRPERQMSTGGFAILRCLIHMAMYLGLNYAKKVYKYLTVNMIQVVNLFLSFNVFINKWCIAENKLFY